MSKATRYMTGLLVAVAMLTAACGGTSEDSGGGAGGGTNATTTAACKPDSTVLRYGVQTENRGFDVVNGGTTGSQGGVERAAVFDTLMEYNAQTGQLTPRMAKSFVPNADFTQWTLKLRDGIKFGSGSPVTTAAVKFSVDRHGAPDTVSLYKPQMDNIKSMDIKSPLEMVFNLKAPRADFAMVFAGAPGMLADPAVFKKMGAEAFGKDPGDGAAGPYEVASYKPGVELDLKKRPGYWGTGDYCVGTIRFIYIASEEARRDAFRNGELDVAFFEGDEVISDLRADKDKEFMTHHWGKWTVLINNGTNGVTRPGSDVRVRKAIAYALDPKVIDERTTGGVGDPSSALVTKESPLWSPGLEGPPYDPDEARALLKQSEADGYNGKITLSCWNRPDKVQWAITVAAELKAVGFDVTVDNQRTLADWVLNVYYPGNYDIGCWEMGVDDAQPWATIQSTLGQDSVAQSRVGYKSPAMAAAMDELRVASTTAEKQAAIKDMQQVWNDEVPAAITAHGYRGVFMQKNVQGLKFMNGPIALFDNARIG